MCLYDGKLLLMTCLHSGDVSLLPITAVEFVFELFLDVVDPMQCDKNVPPAASRDLKSQSPVPSAKLNVCSICPWKSEFPTNSELPPRLKSK